MARKVRVWWPGATYHVMCRGNHQHEIYRDDEDREVYLSVLRQVQITQPYILHTYCLMTNHVHLKTFSLDDGSLTIRIFYLFINILDSQKFSQQNRT